jgi:hypothetical protein
MRLINVKTLELEEFFDIHVPPYAILSHTWSDGEVSLQDWADRKNRRFKPGYGKLIGACRQAEIDELQYLWADTNCIDKASSAELSEAVNSMFKWYKRAHVCYAYLSDVPFAELADCKAPQSRFRAAKWFTRGWTLQELIAPPVVRFFAQDWRELGTKAQLALTIAEETGIGLWCLLRGKAAQLNPLRRYSVAQRLSWASRRSTTLVYGEGSESFTRLLEEIIRKYSDQSIFASQLRYVDFLPRSPKDFCNSQYIIVMNSRRLEGLYSPINQPYPFQMTNIGLVITLPLIPTLSPDVVFGALDCWDADSEADQTSRNISRVWIPLKRKGPRQVSQFTRLLWPHGFLTVRLIQRVKESEFAGTKMADESGSTSDDVAKPDFIDPVSPDMNVNILIKKPFATSITVPPWQPLRGRSPFLVCFPRGTENYCLFNIFPRLNSAGEELNAETVPTLPLVFPSRGVRAGGDMEVHKVLIVFRRRGTQPSKFIAVCLANITRASIGDEVAGDFTPVCKLLPDWAPGKEFDLQNVDVGNQSIVDGGDVLVTVQKTPCTAESRVMARGRSPRSAVLTQVVFDYAAMLRHIGRSKDADLKVSSEMFEHIGKEFSEEDEKESEIMSRKRKRTAGYRG